MSDTMWNLGISTFYIGYLVGQLPGNLWLAKANPRWFLPSTMVAWGAATICTPALKRSVRQVKRTSSMEFTDSHLVVPASPLCDSSQVWLKRRSFRESP